MSHSVDPDMPDCNDGWDGWDEDEVERYEPNGNYLCGHQDALRPIGISLVPFVIDRYSEYTGNHDVTVLLAKHLVEPLDFDDAYSDGIWLQVGDGGYGCDLHIDKSVAATLERDCIPPESAILILAELIHNCEAIAFVDNRFIVELPLETRSKYLERLRHLPLDLSDGPFTIEYHNGPLPNTPRRQRPTALGLINQSSHQISSSPVASHNGPSPSMPPAAGLTPTITNPNKTALGRGLYKLFPIDTNAAGFQRSVLCVGARWEIARDESTNTAYIAGRQGVCATADLSMMGRPYVWDKSTTSGAAMLRLQNDTDSSSTDTGRSNDIVGRDDDEIYEEYRDFFGGHNRPYSVAEYLIHTPIPAGFLAEMDGAGSGGGVTWKRVAAGGKFIWMDEEDAGQGQ
ncbi:hypothetical protein QBC47DRAFT_414332 [Echria macrotheca]|uniref:Uncharacterized protein n=1 Tax=Echria macrotheca TaxID=438768 RepID=A0AAJ0BAA9_9PEZI|nr:hypothetical protein QBC47DRAFT_414332 [Echria macrotheca]